jgi:hypothetical protein
MLQHRSGLHVLTAPNIPMPLEAFHPEVVEQIIDVAQREFDYVIIALTNWTEVVLVRTAMLALVVQLTVPALRQARRLIDLLQEEGHYALPLAVVLNRYARKWNDFLGTKEAEKALGRKVDHVIANDFELVSSALNEGLPAAAINRRGKFCRNIEEMVEATLARWARGRRFGARPVRRGREAGDVQALRQGTGRQLRANRCAAARRPRRDRCAGTRQPVGRSPIPRACSRPRPLFPGHAQQSRTVLDEQRQLADGGRIPPAGTGSRRRGSTDRHQPGNGKRKGGRGTDADR